MDSAHYWTIWPFLWVAFFILWPYLWRGRWHGHKHHDHGPERSPIEHAKERYAKGEITKTEFETIKSDLEK